MYREQPAREIAQRLHRSISSVYRTARRIGLSVHVPRVGSTRDDVIREKLAAGWSDAEIGELFGLTRKTISGRREKLGLPASGNSPHRRRRVAMRTAEQLRKAGLPSIGHLRREAFRKYAVACGWPDDLPPRAVQILNAIWDRGPQTRRELQRCIGMPWLGSRKTLKGSVVGGSYLAFLMRRGYVVTVGRIVRGRGRGRSVQMYTLAENIKRGPIDPSVTPPAIARGVRAHCRRANQEDEQ